MVKLLNEKKCTLFSTKIINNEPYFIFVKPYVLIFKSLNPILRNNFQYVTFSCHGGDGRAMVGLVVGDDTQGQGQGEDQEGADTQGQGQGRPVSPLGQ